MTASPYASTAKIAETVNLLGEPVAEQEVALYKQIVAALALRSGATSVEEALGGSPLADIEPTLLKQILVLIATT